MKGDKFSDSVDASHPVPPNNHLKPVDSKECADESSDTTNVEQNLFKADNVSGTISDLLKRALSKDFHLLSNSVIDTLEQLLLRNSEFSSKILSIFLHAIVSRHSIELKKPVIELLNKLLEDDSCSRTVINILYHKPDYQVTNIAALEKLLRSTNINTLKKIIYILQRISTAEALELPESIIYVLCDIISNTTDSNIVPPILTTLQSQINRGIKILNLPALATRLLSDEEKVAISKIQIFKINLVKGFGLPEEIIHNIAAVIGASSRNVETNAMKCLENAAKQGIIPTTELPYIISKLGSVLGVSNSNKISAISTLRYILTWGSALLPQDICMELIDILNDKSCGTQVAKDVLLVIAKHVLNSSSAQGSTKVESCVPEVDILVKYLRNSDYEIRKSIFEAISKYYAVSDSVPDNSTIDSLIKIAPEYSSESIELFSNLAQKYPGILGANGIRFLIKVLLENKDQFVREKALVLLETQFLQPQAAEESKDEESIHFKPEPDIGVGIILALENTCVRLAKLMSEGLFDNEGISKALEHIQNIALSGQPLTQNCFAILEGLIKNNSSSEEDINIAANIIKLAVLNEQQVSLGSVESIASKLRNIGISEVLTESLNVITKESDHCSTVLTHVFEGVVINEASSASSIQSAIEALQVLMQRNQTIAHDTISRLINLLGAVPDQLPLTTSLLQILDSVLRSSLSLSLDIHNDMVQAAIKNIESNDIAVSILSAKLAEDANKYGGELTPENAHFLSEVLNHNANHELASSILTLLSLFAQKTGLDTASETYKTFSDYSKKLIDHTLLEADKMAAAQGIYELVLAGNKLPMLTAHTLTETLQYNCLRNISISLLASVDDIGEVMTVAGLEIVAISLNEQQSNKLHEEGLQILASCAKSGVEFSTYVLDDILKFAQSTKDTNLAERANELLKMPFEEVDDDISDLSLSLSTEDSIIEGLSEDLDNNNNDLRDSDFIAETEEGEKQRIFLKGVLSHHFPNITITGSVVESIAAKLNASEWDLQFAARFLEEISDIDTIERFSAFLKFVGQYEIGIDVITSSMTSLGSLSILEKTLAHQILQQLIDDFCEFTGSYADRKTLSAELLFLLESSFELESLRLLLSYGIKANMKRDFITAIKIITNYKLSPDIIDDIFVLPSGSWSKALYKIAFSKAPAIKDIDALLAEISQANLDNHQLQQLISSDAFKSQMREIEALETIITPWPDAEITNWAKEVKQNPEKANDLTFLPEMLAVAKKANKLATGNDLRNVQLLSILTALSNTGDAGRLLQVSTGEGKTTTSAIIGAIKALRGEKVDIITSSPVLARRDAENSELQTFFGLLDLSVGHNIPNPDEKFTGLKPCYLKDIVYGDVGNFQYDLLHDEFGDKGTRGGRQFNSVIVDEVDSMMIDESAKIAKLASPPPGSEYLAPVYAAMWYELDRIDESTPDADLEYKKELLKSYAEKIIAGGGNHNFHIPGHLQEFAQMQAPHWARSAVQAKYYMEKDVHYILAHDQKREMVIAPVDYYNTGIVQENTSWEKGLHQFLQLKHGLKLRPETLTTSFISNMGYFKRYGGNIFGMTGTLGSKESRDLLKSIYLDKFDFVFIPTYKHKQFIELGGLLAQSSISETDENNIWIDHIAESVKEEVSRQRAVLLICETIRDTAALYDALIEAGVESSKILKYSRNDNDEYQAINKAIDSGEIIIATNLAGRGTDIKTTQNVEANGGLHVCVTFLPTNLRVEQQAFGRTSRQGKSGTAQLIVKKKSALRGLRLSDDIEVNDIADLKFLRDEVEKERISKAKNTDRDKVELNDDLFAAFCKLTNDLRQTENNKEKLRQVEELWGFEFKKIQESIDLAEDESSESINATKRAEAFQAFESFAAKMKAEYQGETTVFKNSVHLGYMAFNQAGKDNSYALSKQLFTSAAALDPVYGFAAYYNRAYVTIREGAMWVYRKGDKADRGGYQVEAIADLYKAREIILASVVPQLQAMQIVAPQAEGSPLFRQIKNKVDLLRLHVEHIDTAIKTIGGCSGRDFIAISESKLIGEFFDPANAPTTEIEELSFAGLNHIFSVTVETPKASPGDAFVVAVIGVVRIAIGVMSIASGNPLLIAQGVGHILAGCKDLVLGIECATNGEPIDWKSYLTQKAIDIGVYLATAGLSTVAPSEAVKEAAKEAAKEGAKEGAKELTKREFAQAVIKEFALQSIVDYGVQHGINRLTEIEFKRHRSDIESSVRGKIEELFRSTDQQISKLLSCDVARNNGHYQGEITNAANNFLRCNRSIILDFTRQLSHSVASSGGIDTRVRLVAAAAEAGQVTADLSGIMSLTDNFCDQMREKIESLSASAPDVNASSGSASAASPSLSPAPDPEAIASMTLSLKNHITKSVTDQIMGRATSHVIGSMASHLGSYATGEVRQQLNEVEARIKERIKERESDEQREVIGVASGDETQRSGLRRYFRNNDEGVEVEIPIEETDTLWERVQKKTGIVSMRVREGSPASRISRLEAKKGEAKAKESGRQKETATAESTKAFSARGGETLKVVVDNSQLTSSSSNGSKAGNNSGSSSSVGKISNAGTGAGKTRQQLRDESLLKHVGHIDSAGGGEVFTSSWDKEAARQHSQSELDAAKEYVANARENPVEVALDVAMLLPQARLLKVVSYLGKTIQVGAKGLNALYRTEKVQQATTGATKVFSKVFKTNQGATKLNTAPAGSNIISLTRNKAGKFTAESNAASASAVGVASAPARAFKPLASARGKVYRVKGGSENKEVVHSKGNKLTEQNNIATKGSLLPKEGRADTYGALDNQRIKGDNLTPNHVPQFAYMKQFGVKYRDSLAIWMEHPVPGTGGRHRATRTYGRRPNLAAQPRDELAHDIMDMRGLYRKEGIYQPQIRQGFQGLIRGWESFRPDLFSRNRGSVNALRSESGQLHKTLVEELPIAVEASTARTSENITSKTDAASESSQSTSASKSTSQSSSNNNIGGKNHSCEGGSIELGNPARPLSSVSNAKNKNKTAKSKLQHDNFDLNSLKQKDLSQNITEFFKASLWWIDQTTPEWIKTIALQSIPVRNVEKSMYKSLITFKKQTLEEIIETEKQKEEQKTVFEETSHENQIEEKVKVNPSRLGIEELIDTSAILEEENLKLVPMQILPEVNEIELPFQDGSRNENYFDKNNIPNKGAEIELVLEQEYNDVLENEQNTYEGQVGETSIYGSSSLNTCKTEIVQNTTPVSKQLEEAKFSVLASDGNYQDDPTNHLPSITFSILSNLYLFFAAIEAMMIMYRNIFEQNNYSIDESHEFLESVNNKGEAESELYGQHYTLIEAY